jgi:Glycerophosphoryl diester phosphodiesterase
MLLLNKPIDWHKIKTFMRITVAIAVAATALLSCSGGVSKVSEGATTSAEALTSLAVPSVVYSAPEGVTPWYEADTVIAHALGNIDGRSETNSAEAFAATYAKGQRVFETDLVLTSDGHLVARHDFADDSYYTLEQEKPENPIMDLKTFKSTPIMGIYTPVTIEDIAGWMAEYSDMWIVTDTKSSDAETVKAQFERLCEALGSDSRLDRVIVQLYNTDMYDVVNSIYPFKNYIFTVYQLAERDFNQIGSFCAENGIAVVTMPSSTADASVTALLHSFGLKVFVHTVNRITTMKTMLEYGLCDGFYSDYVIEPELKRYLG